jgi:CDP-paratose 2-epimerase
MTVTLITGGGGFIGTNLAHRIASDGGRVIVYDNSTRAGVEHNLRWLAEQHGPDIDIEFGDVRDQLALGRCVREADRVFHLAAQVAVTTSLEEPAHDADVNLRGTLNLLEEARRKSRPPAIVFTSTNKVYGNLSDVALVERETRYEPADETLRRHGIGEGQALSFCTPYGCSKGAADQYVLDYAHSYGVPALAFRMSCIYGPHQCGNEDQGWVAHFVIRALEGRPVTIYGDGKQVRDVLYVDDLVEALLRAARDVDRLAGEAFNIGGGPAHCVSLLEVLDLIGELQGSEALTDFGPWRQGDQRYYVSDPRAFGAATGWRPRVAPREGVALLHDWLQTARRDGRRALAA